MFFDVAPKLVPMFLSHKEQKFGGVASLSDSNHAGGLGMLKHPETSQS